MLLRFRRTAGLLAIALMLTFTFSAFAQTSRGTLTGTVTDPSGAVVANATIVLTNTATGVVRQAATNNSGLYRFDAVDLGTYTVEARGTGFAATKKTGIDIQAAHTATVDFSLQVGQANQELTVEADAAEVALQRSEQVRGQNLETRAIENMPMVANDPLTLTQVLPGVAIASNNSINQDGNMFFAVNGQRPRGNNFMIDGVENNDISITGPAYTIQNFDAVQEVNIQTSNFTAEFGRAGGAVINEVTKSGTNNFHGTATEIYTGSAFKALNHQDALAGLKRPPRQVENIPDFTFGGPVILPHIYNGKGKTFFFVASQWDHLHGATTANVRVPTAAGLAVLQSLAPACPNVALYVKALGGLVATPNTTTSNISISAPSATGTCNGTARTGMAVETAKIARVAPQASLDANQQVRVDHVASEKQTLSFRFLYDKNQFGPSLNNLPGFDRNFTGLTLQGGFSDTYVLNASTTNEFRFNYGRIAFNFPPTTNDPFYLNLPFYSLVGQSDLFGQMGRATNMPQFRDANNWQYQDTMTVVHGTHTFRFGADFLRQLAKQHPPFNERGSLSFAASSGVTAFSNFIDNYAGNGGAENRQFGVSIYYPNLLRQSYFAEDSWKIKPNLTFNYGLRYENFGTPVNYFKFAAFTGYDPTQALTPRKVNPDNDNFAPSLGIAYSPQFDSGILGWLFGNNKSVWRAGYQISYDTWFNNLLSNIAGSSPNTVGGNVTSTLAKGSLSRGTANWTSQFTGIVPHTPIFQDAQSNLFDPNMQNPYTEHWSFGVQREMPGDMVLDLAYVGSEGHRLFRSLDLNPIVDPTTGARFAPQLQSATPKAGEGIRTIRCACSNSNFNSLQANLRRRFSHTPIGSLQFSGSYTYGHFLDEISDVFAQDSNFTSLQSVSQVTGTSPRIDYASSDFDRRHVGVIAWVWDVRAPKNGLLGQVLGGWTISGVSHWQTGLPFTLSNGTDRNGDGQNADRPDLSNLLAPLDTRAIISAKCVTGYANPDASGACVDPSTVHFIEGTGNPNALTVGRNSLRANGVDNVDLNITKAFRLSERFQLQYRLAMYNAFNWTNYGDVPNRTINGSAAGTFLNYALDDNSIGRSMRMGLRLSF